MRRFLQRCCLRHRMLAVSRRPRSSSARDDFRWRGRRRGWRSCDRRPGGRRDRWRRNRGDHGGGDDLPTPPRRLLLVRQSLLVPLSERRISSGPARLLRSERRDQVAEGASPCLARPFHV